MTRFYTATIEGDGGFTLPPELLDRLQWKDGDPLEFKADEYGIAIRKVDVISDLDPEGSNV